MSNPSSKNSGPQQQKEAKGHLASGLPFTVGAAQWHVSSWAILKPLVKPSLPTPVQDLQEQQDQSDPIQFHKLSPIP